MRTKNRRFLLAVPLLLGGTLAGTGSAGAAPGSTSGSCTVPRLTGTPLIVVRPLLPLLGCRLGRISTRPAVSIDKNAVISTSPSAGSYRRNTVVNLVISGGAASGGPSSATTGRGTNDDPYTGPCVERVDGSCRVSFPSRQLRAIFDNEYVPAYRCPASDPWLLNKTVTEGRIVPPGVLFEAGNGANLGVNITGVSKKEGKTEKRGQKVYAFDYATGTLTGFPNSSVTSWSFGSAFYAIGLYCTSDLKKASLADVRG